MTVAETSTKKRPKKPGAKELAAAEQEQLLAALVSARSAGDYPLTVGQLAAGVGKAADQALKSLGKAPIKDRVLLAHKTSHDAPLALSDDGEMLASSALLLRFAAERVRSHRSAKALPLRADVKKFVANAALDKRLQAAFQTSLQRQYEARTLPADVGELIAPLPLPIAEVADKLVAIVRSQRNAAALSYPVLESRLLELADFGASAKDLKAALKEPAFSSLVLSCSIPAKPAASKKAYLLRADFAEPPPTLIARALELAIGVKKHVTAKGTAASALEIAGAFFGQQAKSRFANAIDLGAERKTIPAGIAWVWIKGSRFFFRTADVEPNALAAPDAQAGRVSDQIHSTAETASSSVHDFQAQFDAAFERIDARTGKRNFLKLYDLRRELPQFSRQAFDAGLNKLRIADRYTLDSSQGGAVRLSDEERGAGIHEGSSLLVYVSRK